VYLQGRGFDDPDQVIKDYNLKCCLTGTWKGRLIIPVYDKKLLGWQGRSIRTVDGVARYLTSHPAVKRNLFNLQNLSSGEYLYICEGPFDAIKIDFYGKPRIRATCTFGVDFTPEQIHGLYNLRGKFAQLVALFDFDAAGISGGFALNDWL